MAAYDVAFEYEIANEVIAEIKGFIFRNYLLTGKTMPKEVAEIDKESREIYKKLPLEHDIDNMRAYKNHLIELMKSVKQMTPQPHR